MAKYLDGTRIPGRRSLGETRKRLAWRNEKRQAYREHKRRVREWDEVELPHGFGHLEHMRIR